MIYLSEKNTQKPCWSNLKSLEFKKFREQFEQAAGPPDKSIGRVFSSEKMLIMKHMVKFLPGSMKDQLRKKVNQNKIQSLINTHDSPYYSDPLFKQKVARVLDMFGSRDTSSSDGRVSFKCKSFNK